MLTAICRLAARRPSRAARLGPIWGAPPLEMLEARRVLSTASPASDMEVMESADTGSTVDGKASLKVEKGFSTIKK